MSSDPTSYTPAQYLEAGYRSEQAGERERAAQYYVYVAETFPETPEGEAARGGLVRIGQSGQLQAPPQPREPAYQQNAPTHADVAQHAPSGPVNSRQQQQPPPAGYMADAPSPYGTPRTGAPMQRPHTAPAPMPNGPPNGLGQPSSPYPQHQLSAGGAPGYAPPPAAGAGQRIVLGELARLKLAPGTGPGGNNGPSPGYHPPPAAQPPVQRTDHPAAHDEHAQHEPMRLPDVVARRARDLAEADAYAPQPKYRGGRVLARMFVWVGWLAVAGGLAEIVLATLFGGGGPVGLNLGVAVAAILGLVAIVFGLLIVLVGQLALAVFDGSNAMRVVAAIMRARSDL